MLFQQLQMKPWKLKFEFWRRPPFEVFYKVYIFNVTNADAFRDGIDEKLVLQEVGPYTYQ